MANDDIRWKILKECKENEHRIFVKVPVGRKQIEYSLAQLPASLWAARVLSYLLRGCVPQSDIRQPDPEESKGSIIATCGHRIKDIMWEVLVREGENEVSMVVCPKCYRSRGYDRTCKGWRSHKVLLRARTGEKS